MSPVLCPRRRPARSASALASIGAASLLGLSLLGAGVGCSRSTPSPGAGSSSGPSRPAPTVDPAAAERTLSLFFITRLLNTPEPCGCSSEPLGDVARLVALLKTDAAGSLLLDAGGLRYDDVPMDAEKLRQARTKADFLERTLAGQGAIVMLQPEDLRGGLAGLGEELRGVRRLAGNVSGLPEGLLVREVVRELRGVKIGVLGLADPERPWPAGVTVGDPIAAATEGVQRLQAQGAQLVVALTGLKRDATRRLLRKVRGISVAVAGSDRDLAEGVESAEAIGEALLLVPADKGQAAARLTLHLPPTGAPTWRLHLSEAQQRKQAEALAAQLALVEARLKGLRADPGAEPAFVRTTEVEAERLRAELTKARTPSPPPPVTAQGGYAVAELVPIRRRLPRDPEVAKQMKALDRAIGEANLAALTGPPPAAGPREQRYVGTAGCIGGCHFHDDAVAFWRGTHHSGAWKTLVEGGKDLSYDCVSCHATGFDRPSGSNLWTLARWQRAAVPDGGAAGTAPDGRAGPDLRDVQCEVCHGPGSMHALSPGKYPVPIPRPTEARCLECHTKEHSDTFQYEAYLRDILGEGHGADRRKELGDGPTGHELRSAALKKAAGAH